MGANYDRINLFDGQNSLKNQRPPAEWGMRKASGRGRDEALLVVADFRHYFYALLLFTSSTIFSAIWAGTSS